MTRRADRALRWLERALVAIGVACVSWYGYTTMQAAQFQREQTAAFETLLDRAPAGDIALPPPAAPRADAVPLKAPPVTPPVTLPRGVALPDARMIGLLEVPRLGLSTAVLAGDDEKTLKKAAGHLPDTPRPWESGNSAIAAHRDTHFRPLRNIRVGDEVRMRTTRGDLTYRVREIRIVTPDDLSVLEPGDTDTLTLITCYPFNYIGSAPKRYIVRAEKRIE
jgi:sortase A